MIIHDKSLELIESNHPFREISSTKTPPKRPLAPDFLINPCSISTEGKI